MQRLTELIGKPIVSGDTGEKLGTVADVLLDNDGRHLVGVVVRSGWMGTEHVLPYEGVQTLGRDALVARSRRELIGSREWRAHGMASGADRPEGRRPDQA